MTELRNLLQGLWLPLITPFRNGELDEPSQRGLSQHFTALADHASWPIVLYNIPYRTGVRIENDTLLRLAEHPNIVGMKDCCADRAQSIELLRRRPAGFRVLTGEDAEYHN